MRPRSVNSEPLDTHSDRIDNHFHLPRLRRLLGARQLCGKAEQRPDLRPRMQRDLKRLTPRQRRHKRRQNRSHLRFSMKLLGVACCLELFQGNMRSLTLGWEEQYIPILIPHGCWVLSSNRGSDRCLRYGCENDSMVVLRFKGRGGWKITNIVETRGKCCECGRCIAVNRQ